jgi:hypothetical protein
MKNYVAVTAVLSAFILGPSALPAQTVVDSYDLAGTSDNFPPDCVATDEPSSFTYTGGKSVTIMTVKSNADNTSTFVSVVSYFDHATAIGEGTLVGVNIDNASYRIVEASASMNVNLKNGYGENDQVMYESFIGKGAAPDIIGYSIMHVRIWQNPTTGEITYLRDIEKSRFSCPATR